MITKTISLPQEIWDRIEALAAAEQASLTELLTSVFKADAYIHRHLDLELSPETLELLQKVAVTRHCSVEELAARELELWFAVASWNLNKQFAEWLQEKYPGNESKER